MRRRLFLSPVTLAMWEGSGKGVTRLIPRLIDLLFAHAAGSYGAIILICFGPVGGDTGGLACILIGAPITFPLLVLTAASNQFGDTFGLEAIAFMSGLYLIVFSITLYALSRRRLRLTRLHGCCCLRCGYSLTGNTSGVCPECGTPVPKEPADESPRPA